MTNRLLSNTLKSKKNGCVAFLDSNKKKWETVPCLIEAGMTLDI